VQVLQTSDAQNCRGPINERGLQSEQSTGIGSANALGQGSLQERPVLGAAGGKNALARALSEATHTHRSA
jgi:hypothetical protein